MLTEEQTESIKRKLIEQIDHSFPEDKKEFAINQINGMDSEQLEAFLIKNNLLKPGSGKNISSSDQCVFCSIIAGNIESYKIAQNSKAIAVLEINPFSKGHVIIIPKEHVTSEGELSPQVMGLAKKISDLIKIRLKPESVDISYSNILGHEIINVIPLYNEKKPTERKPAEKEELEEIQKILTKKTFSDKKEKNAEKKPEKEKLHKKIVKEMEKLWLPKRIP
ncbi:MAG: HIT domain-containing protein [Candidatus Pacearchaeota archaeon]|jgi:histidine triad (HIT) family protein